MAVENSEASLLLQILAVLRDKYLAQLPEELAVLKRLATGLIGGENDRASLEDLHRRLHKLAGCGGTFGLAKPSVEARALEQRIMVWLSSSLSSLESGLLHVLVADITSFVSEVDSNGVPVLPSEKK